MFAAVLIPDFELQCSLRAEPELAAAVVALVEENVGGAAPVILQINSAAQRAGVSVGLSVPQAQARCAEIIFRHRSSGQETVATAALLQTAERVAPYLENTFPGCCTIDLRRQGECAPAIWAQALVAALQALHLQAQVGIASTPEAALQAARLARPVLIVTEARQSLAELPIVVLEPSPPVLNVLADWGIQRIADLQALDRQQVAERLGTEGLALWDRAGGGKVRPLRLVRAAAIYEEAAEFDGGVETLEPVLFRLRRALEQLTRRLQTDLLLVGSINFYLDLDDRTVLARTVNIPAPTCTLDVLFRVMSTYLDTIQTDSRVNGFRIRANPSTPRDHQTHLWGGSLRDPNGFFETLARLGAIVGSERVGVPQRPPTHRPNRCNLTSPDFDANQTRRKTKSEPPEVAFLPLGLSLRRYRPPRSVVVEKLDDQPAWLRAGEVEGKIKACTGPWQLDGDWWDAQQAWGWEEWDVELATGALFRLAHHRRERWWLLGLYD